MRITGVKLAPFGEELRRTAECRVQTWSREIVQSSVEELQVAIQELHVYEAELEIQNEELIESRRTIEESQKRYFRHFDLAPVGLIRLDSQGVIMEANILGSQMLGLERAQLHVYRRAMLAHIAPGSMVAFQQHLANVLVSGGRETCELTLRKPAGPELLVRAQSIRIQNEDGSSDIYISVTDLTEQRQIETQLAEQKAIAESARLAANLPREQLFAMLAYELRTPLTPVLALVKELEAVPGGSKEENAAFAMMRRKLELEVRRAEELLDIARVSFLEHLAKPLDIRELDAAIQCIAGTETSHTRVSREPQTHCGEEEQFAAFVEVHFSSAYGFAHCMSLTHDDAAGLVRSVFADLHGRHVRGDRGHLDKRDIFAALYREWVERKSRQNASCQAEAPSSMDLMLLDARRDTSDQSVVLTIVHAMPEELRLVLSLFYFEQLGYTEIMQILQLPGHLVQSRLEAANALLQRQLQIQKRQYRDVPTGFFVKEQILRDAQDSTSGDTGS